MPTELEDLKRRILQMNDDDLRAMVINHSDYRQETLDLATEELTRRNISFRPPPSSKPDAEIARPRLTVKEGIKRFGLMMICLAVAAVMLLFAARIFFSIPAEGAGRVNNIVVASGVTLVALILIGVGVHFLSDDDQEETSSGK